LLNTQQQQFAPQFRNIQALYNLMASRNYTFI